MPRSEIAVVRLRRIDATSGVLGDDLNDDGHCVLGTLVPDVVQMPAAKVDCAIADAVNPWLAQIGFVHGDLTGGNGDQAWPRMGVPAALAARNDRVAHDID